MATNVSQVQATMASCLRLCPAAQPRRLHVDMNFPSVSYVWKAEERRGAEVVLVQERRWHRCAHRADAGRYRRAHADGADQSCALFRSSYIQDAAAIVKRAHEVGALVLLDVYQSAGIVPLDVTALGVDFATAGR
jgi:kynureninase